MSLKDIPLKGHMSQHPVPDEHLKHIGDMTVSFAMLEMLIEFFVVMFFPHKYRIGEIATAELSFKKLRALLTSLYLAHFGEDEGFQKLRDLMRRAATVEGRRDQITHSVWGAGAEVDTITRTKATTKQKHGLRFQFEEVTSEDLASFVCEIKALAAEISNFRLSLAGKPFRSANDRKK
jgi:hypothetical protein